MTDSISGSHGAGIVSRSSRTFTSAVAEMARAFVRAGHTVAHVISASSCHLQTINYPANDDGAGLAQACLVPYNALRLISFPESSLHPEMLRWQQQAMERLTQDVRSLSEKEKQHLAEKAPHGEPDALLQNWQALVLIQAALLEVWEGGETVRYGMDAEALAKKVADLEQVVRGSFAPTAFSESLSRYNQALFRHEFSVTLPADIALRSATHALRAYLPGSFVFSVVRHFFEGRLWPEAIQEHIRQMRAELRSGCGWQEFLAGEQSLSSLTRRVNGVLDSALMVSGAGLGAVSLTSCTVAGGICALLTGAVVQGGLDGVLEKTSLLTGPLSLEEMCMLREIFCLKGNAAAMSGQAQQMLSLLAEATAVTEVIYGAEREPGAGVLHPMLSLVREPGRQTEPVVACFGLTEGEVVLTAKVIMSEVAEKNVNMTGWSTMHRRVGEMWQSVRRERLTVSRESAPPGASSGFSGRTKGVSLRGPSQCDAGAQREVLEACYSVKGLRVIRPALMWKPEAQGEKRALSLTRRNVGAEIQRASAPASKEPVRLTGRGGGPGDIAVWDKVKDFLSGRDAEGLAPEHAEGGSAWPFSGASAHKATATRGGVPHPPKTRAQGSASGTGAKKRHNFHVRRRHPHTGHIPGQAPPGKNMVHSGGSHTASSGGGREGGMRGHSSDNKESMMSPSSDSGGSAGATSKKHTHLKNKKKAQSSGAEDADSSREVAQKSGSAILTKSQTQETDDGESVAEHLPGTSSASESCLRFHSTHDTWHQVMATRFFPHGDIIYCFHYAGLPVFEAMLAENTGAKKSIMVTEVIHIPLSPLQKKIVINKYRGIGQLTRHASGYAQETGRDDLFTVMSISEFPDKKLRHRNIAGDRILSRNSFKLVKVARPGSDDVFFIVYFLYASEGVRPGFLKVDTRDRKFSVEDETGFIFSSDSMADFLAGFSRFSGLQFRPDSESVPDSGAPLRQDITVTRARHFFIRSEAVREDEGNHHRKKLNTALNPLSPVTFSQYDGLQLYRTCFSLNVSDNRIIYVDQQGINGTLKLFWLGQRYRLEEHDGHNAQFIREYGLQEGKCYLIEELTDILINYGMTWIPFPGEEQKKNDYRIDNFYIQTDTDSVGHLPAEPAYEKPALFFSFTSGHLQYIDQKGREGSIRLHNEAPGIWMYSQDDNDSRGDLFALQHGLIEGARYTEKEVCSRLYKHHYILVSDNIYKKIRQEGS